MQELITQLLSLVKGVWKYRWYAVIVAWVAALAGWATVYKLHDDFQASARVYVDTQNILKPLLSGMTSTPNIEQQVSIMSRTLLSRPNVERVMRMVDLDIKAKTTKDHEQLVDDLISQIKISTTGRDDLYTILYNNENPKLAKDVVQSFLTIFVEGSVGNKKQDSEQAVHFIDEQIKTYEEKLVAAENALKDFKIRNAGLLPRQGSDYGTKLAETSDSLNQAKLELVEAEQARNSIKNQISGDEPALMEVQAPTPTPQSTEIDGRIQLLNKNLDALRLQFTEQHPDIISTKRLIAQLEASKREEAKQHKQTAAPGASYSPMMQQLKVSLSEADAKVAAMKARVEEYATRNNRLKSMSNAAPAVEQQLSQLNRDYQVNKENYEKLVERRESAKLSGDLNVSTEMMTFKVIDPPTVPSTPAGPNRIKLSSLVLIGALLAGIAAAFLMSQIRPTFLSQHDLREITGLHILGSVTMNLTDQEKLKRKKEQYAFILSFAMLLIIFSAGITMMLLKLK